MSNLLSPVIPPTGWYKLTADVTNPAPDGRRKDVASRKVWQKGLVVYVEQRTAGLRHEIKFSDGSYAYIGGYQRERDWDKIYCQGNEILNNIEPAPLTVGRVVKKAWGDPVHMLAMLVDDGTISLGDIQALDKRPRIARRRSV
jgi:hypothetical protein